MGVRDSTSALFALGSLTLGHDNSASRARSGTLTTHHDGRRRWPPTTSRWQVGRAFSFSHYTTEEIPVSGDPAFRPPLEPPDRRRRPPEDEERGWSGSFLYHFLETPRLLREIGGLGKLSGPALLWEAGHYQMRMHYIGRRELRDFYVTAVITAGGGSKG